MFDIKIEKNDNETIVFLEGMIDSTTSESFAKKIQDVLIQKPSILILDFEKVDYISSAGFRILFMIAKEIKRNQGRLLARHVREQIMTLFKMVHMEHVMEISEE